MLAWPGPGPCFVSISLVYGNYETDYEGLMFIRASLASPAAAFFVCRFSVPCFPFSFPFFSFSFFVVVWGVVVEVLFGFYFLFFCLFVFC